MGKTKFCKYCSRDRKISFFPFRDKPKNIRFNKCKKCFREYSAKYYQIYKEEHKNKVKRNKKENQDINYEALTHINYMFKCYCGAKDIHFLYFFNEDTKRYKSIMSLIKDGWTSWRIEDIASESRIICANCYLLKK